MAVFSSGVYITFAVIACLICFFGTVLNGLTLATLIKNPRLMTVPNIIIFSMCLSDFISSVVANPLIAQANIKQKWPFGDAGCKAYAFLTTLCGLTSINHLAGAAFERYDSLDRASRGCGLFTERRAVYFVIFLWLYSLLFSVAPLANWSSYTLEGIGTSCSVHWSASDPNAVSYTVVLYLCCFVLPLAVIGFSYFKVYKVVREIRINANTAWGSSSTAATDAVKTEKKMALLVLAMIVAFLLSWTPYAVVALISGSGYGNLISPLGASIPSYIAKLSCIYNPIIYALLFKNFRQKMLAFFFICIGRPNLVHPESINSRTTRETNTARTSVVVRSTGIGAASSAVFEEDRSISNAGNLELRDAV